MNTPSCCFKQYMAVILICKIIIKVFLSIQLNSVGSKQHCSSLTFENLKNVLTTCLHFVLSFYFLVNYRFNLFGSKIRTRIIEYRSNLFTNASMSFFSLCPSMCPSPPLPPCHWPSFSLTFLPPVLSIQPEDIFKSILACAFSHCTLLGSRDRNNIVWWNFTST